MDSNGPETQQVPIPIPVSPEAFVPPELRDGELFHVFVSYSSSDLQWTQALIQQLEDNGLRVCYHERDFTPGHSILENMSDCITQSQKVLLVLSPDFVRSRWCLLEANMSLFRDCLQRKPIVPVLLQKDLSIPALLAHLTYLELSHPDFSHQLLRVLCTPNNQLNNSAMVPYQPQGIYNGHVFQPLRSLIQVFRFNSGVWSTEIPQPLRRFIRNKELYKEAVERINKVQREKVRFIFRKPSLNLCFLEFLLFVFFVFGLIYSLLVTYTFKNGGMSNIISAVVATVFALLSILKLIHFCKTETVRVFKVLKNAVCETNTYLYQENILMGASWNRNELYLVYVMLDACKHEITGRFPEKDMFNKALMETSSDYVYWLSVMSYPVEPFSPGHLDGSVCFCQYFFHVLESQKHLKESLERPWCVTCRSCLVDV